MNRLKAWLHWTEQDENATEDAKMMARDIKLLFEVVEAAKRAVHPENTNYRPEAFRALAVALAKLEGEG